jgi:hypothetical protein
MIVAADRRVTLFLQNTHSIVLSGDLNERGWPLEGHQHPSTVTATYVNIIPSSVLQRRKKACFRGRDNGVCHLKFLFVVLMGQELKQMEFTFQLYCG